jgi:hypothetical protein
MDQLIQSGREARSALLIGLAVLFSAWLLDGARLIEWAVGEQTFDRLSEGLDVIGPAGVFLLVAISAGAVGTLAMNLGGAWLVARLMRIGGQPPWGEYQKAALTTARAYGEFRVRRYFSPFYTQEANRPSTEYERHLMAEHDHRVSQEQEVAFRVAVVLSLGIVMGAFAVHGGRTAIPAGSALTLLAIVDLTTMNRRVVKAMRAQELSRHEGALAREQETLGEMSSIL